MESEQVTMRLLKPWKFNPVGREIVVTPGVADVLTRNRTAEIVLTTAKVRKAKGPK